MKKLLTPDRIFYVLSILFAVVMLPLRNDYLLRWIDETSLFETDAFTVSFFLSVPGGVLQFAGNWLTQFMYYPWLGSLILIAFWVILTLLIVKAFKVKPRLRPLAVAVPMALLLSVTQLDEVWLTLNSPGFLFTPTLGFMITASAVWLIRLLRLAWARMAVAAVFAAIYPWLGFYALAAVALCMLMEAVRALKSRRIIGLLWILIPLAVVILVPYLYYWNFNGTYADGEMMWLKGLPSLTMEGYDFYMWVPFIIIMIVMGALAVVSDIDFNEKALKTGGWISVGVVLALGVAVCVADSRRSEQFRATVLMSHYVGTLQWDRAANIMNNITEAPTREMQALCGLALNNMGMQPMRITAPERPDGGNPRKSAKLIESVFVNVPVYFHIGDHNASYRWAMEHTVSYGKRVYFLKYMVKNALAMRDFELARKYNAILLKTMFHKNWAKEYQMYIDNPEWLEGSEEFRNLPQMPAFKTFV